MNEQYDNTFQLKIEKIRERCTFDFINLAFLRVLHQRKEEKLVYASGNTSSRYLRIVLQSRKGLAGQVIKTGRPAFITDVDKEIKSENLQNYPIIMAEGLKSLCALPLFEDENVVGVVLAGFRTSNKMSQELIQQFTYEVRQAFDHLKSRELVNSDESFTSIPARSINKSV